MKYPEYLIFYNYQSQNLMKKNNISKDFNFASSMFAVKDIQNQYMQFAAQQQKPKDLIINQQQKPKDVKPLKPIKQQLSNLNKPKAKIANNEKVNIILTHKNEVKQKKNQQEFPIKVQQKLRPQQKLELITLNCLEVEKDVYELTSNQKPTQWEYNVFDDSGQKSSEIVQNPKVTFSLNQENIKQGSVGNCYFICSLGALSKVNNLLNRRIPQYKKYDQTTNNFMVNMFESGKLVKFPVQNSFKNFYSKPVQNDMSCLILQKAYAQLYGNFQIINMGHAIDSLRDLSGAQAQYIDLKDINLLRPKIEQAFNNKYPIVIASKSLVCNISISPKHSYNVLDYKIKYENLFVKLRDPRGWSNSTFKVPVQLDTENQNGVFWVDYQSLKTNFQVITICKPNPNNSYYFKTFSEKELSLKFNDGYSALYFQLNQPSKVCLSSHQKHKKFFDQKYLYEMVKIMICEVNQNGKFVKCIKSDFKIQQVCSLQLNLASGYYIAIGSIRMNKKNSSYLKQRLTISLYSQTKIFNIKIAKQYDIQRYLAGYIEENQAQFKQTKSNEGLFRHHGSLFGFMCIYYRNLSNKNVKEQLQYQCQNIEITQKKVVLQKGQTKLILNPIGSKNNGSHKCVFKSRTFYQQIK